MKGGIVPFPKKDDLRFTVNYSGITLFSVAPKIYLYITECYQTLKKKEKDF